MKARRCHGRWWPGGCNRGGTAREQAAAAGGGGSGSGGNNGGRRLPGTLGRMARLSGSSVAAGSAPHAPESWASGSPNCRKLGSSGGARRWVPWAAGCVWRSQGAPQMPQAGRERLRGRVLVPRCLRWCLPRQIAASTVWCGGDWGGAMPIPAPQPQQAGQPAQGDPWGGGQSRQVQPLPHAGGAQAMSDTPMPHRRSQQPAQARGCAARVASSRLPPPPDAESRSNVWARTA